MNTKKVDILIIGGGLCGIYAAAMLLEKKQSVILLEARSRLGGRILSLEHQGFFSDLGPSWYWPAINPKVTALVQKLNIDSYPQFETGMGRYQTKDGHTVTIDGYPMQPPGRRLNGGMISLINGLCAGIPKDIIRLNHPVCEIQRCDYGARVVVGQLDHEPIACFKASKIILAIPPRLAAGSMLFTPDLPFDLSQAMLKASTWMAGQAKFFALYNEAHWRKYGLSGQGFSMCGPLGEIHDGSCPAESPYGLTGFVGIPALRRKDPDTMIQRILVQLQYMFGPEAGNPVKVYYHDWARKQFTATEYDQRSAHNHPEFHPPSGKTSVWNNTLHLAGSETADKFGGYLEGALCSARRAALSLL